MTNHIATRETVEKLLPQVSPMHRPNLKSLNVFTIAAQHLNFRLAADALHLTQGAVAQQVRQLEADLGVMLFHRLPRGLALTAKGKQYHQAVGHALRLIEEATQALTEPDNHVMISVTPSMASKWLVPRLINFEQQFPDIDLQVTASEALSNFQSDGVDIAVRYGYPAVDPSLHAEYLVPIHLLAVCSIEYAKTNGLEHTNDEEVSFQVNDPTTFVAHRLIQDSHGHWDEWLATVNLQATRRMMAFNQTALAIDAAINGQGITLVPSILVQNHLDNGQLIGLWEHQVLDERGYYLVYPKQPVRDDTVLLSVQQWLRETLLASTMA